MLSQPRSFSIILGFDSIFSLVHSFADNRLIT